MPLVPMPGAGMAIVALTLVIVVIVAARAGIMFRVRVAKILLLPAGKLAGQVNQAYMVFMMCMGNKRMGQKNRNGQKHEQYD